MNLFIRFIVLLVKRLVIKNPIDFFSPCTTRFRVNLLDLDLNFHMNNGRYLSIMDLGRFDLMLKSKSFWKITKAGYYPVISSESIRFRKSLQLGQAFDLVTKIESWDERDFYIAQQFVHKGQVVAEGFIKGRFLKRGKKGSVPNTELFEFMGLAFPEEPITDRANMQKQMEGVLASKKKMGV